MLVTVGICVRNAESVISSTIRSVLEQDFPHDEMEIVLIDDGSTDRTLEVAKKIFSGVKARTRIYSQKWKGIATARNVVVSTAKGKYILWADAGMQIARNYLRKHVDYMERRSRVGMARGRYDFVRSSSIVGLLENSRAFDIRGRNSKLIGTGGSMWRTEAIRQVGGFDERIKGAGEDTEALIRMLQQGWSLAVVNTRFLEKFKDSRQSVWIQYYWWGYGAHYVWHKHKHIISFLGRLPPASFFTGLLRIFPVYKKDHRIVYLLLPFHEVFRNAAWCAGFVSSHFKDLGHNLPRIEPSVHAG